MIRVGIHVNKLTGHVEKYYKHSMWVRRPYTVYELYTRSKHGAHGNCRQTEASDTHKHLRSLEETKYFRMELPIRT